MTTDTDVLSISNRQRETERDRRIHQLEAQCATLAAEVDRMRPVVEAAQGWAHGGASKWLPILAMTINDYEASRPK